MIGSVLGNYRLLEEIGGGGMGTVYSGEHQTLGRRAAIKVLHSQLSRDTDMVARIFTEARAAALLAHPGLVDVYDFGHLPDGAAYIVMELLEGESLADRLDKELKLPVDTAVALARQVASAVDAAHQKGIVHRDLKPDNVFLVRDDDVAGGERAKVLDFGIAKLAADEMRNSIRTKTGQLMGTPAYMSPEQCRGAASLDRRADVYSLGCIIFEMLTGRPPYDFESMGEIIAAHLYGPVPMLRDIDPSVPLWLEAVVAKALSKKPEDRQQSMEQLASQLADAKKVTLPPLGNTAVINYPTKSGPATVPYRHPPPPRRNGIVWALGGAALMAAAAVGFIVLRQQPPEAVAAQPTAPVTSPVPVEPPAEPAAEPPPIEILPDPAPETVTLKIGSSPPGADVYRALDGIKLGQTPLEQTLPRSSGLAVFVLKLSGHRDARVELPAGADGSAEVVLKRRSKSRVRGDDAALDPFSR